MRPQSSPRGRGSVNRVGANRMGGRCRPAWGGGLTGPWNRSNVGRTGRAALRGGGALGTEIDLISTLPLRAQTVLEAGLALFAPGARLEAAGQPDNAFWGYVQAVVSF